MDRHLGTNQLSASALAPTSISSRGYYSILMIQSGALFARRAYEVEQQLNDSNHTELAHELQSYAMATVFSTTAFLEATINEIFSDAAESGFSSLRPKVKEDTALNELSVRLLGGMWERGVEKAQTVEKYQIALTLLQQECFDEGTNPMQCVMDLIKLRNHLIHFKPSTVRAVTEGGNPGQAPRSLQLLKRLYGQFPLHPIRYLLAPMNQILAHGCAEWAVKNSVAFADDFFNRIGMEPTFDHVRNNLHTR